MTQGSEIDLIDAFCLIQDRATMEAFFKEIFTSAEQRDLSLRWQLMTMLRDGVSQREIATRLGISLCKITRGSRILRNPQSISNSLLAQDNQGEEK